VAATRIERDRQALAPYGVHFGEQRLIHPWWRESGRADDDLARALRRATAAF
jgi:hypothetical protein